MHADYMNLKCCLKTDTHTHSPVDLEVPPELKNTKDFQNYKFSDTLYFYFILNIFRGTASIYLVVPAFLSVPVSFMKATFTGPLLRPNVVLVLPESDILKLFDEE